MSGKWKDLQPRVVSTIGTLKEEVIRLQNRDGFFPSDSHEENADITATAMTSLYLINGMTDPVKKAMDYLVSLFQDGRAYRNPWLGNADDPKITAVIVGGLRKIDPTISEIGDGIKFIEGHIDKEGKPVLPDTYSMQNPLAAALDILRALPPDPPKQLLVIRYIFSQQRADGSFDIPPVSLKEPLYKTLQIFGVTRTEITSGVVSTFIEDLSYPPYNPQIRAAVEYITPRKYPQASLLSERLLRRFPSATLAVVNATLIGNPGVPLDELPQHKYQAVAKVLSYQPSGVNQTVHTLRQLIRLQDQLYKRL